MFLYESFEAAPTCCVIISPLLNMASVGMLNMLYFDASSPLSSTFTLTKFTFPEYSPASSSTKFCSECGTKISQNAKFCTECGATQD